jgi:hypothetical protein
MTFLPVPMSSGLVCSSLMPDTNVRLEKLAISKAACSLVDLFDVSRKKAKERKNNGCLKETVCQSEVKRVF